MATHHRTAAEARRTRTHLRELPDDVLVALIEVREPDAWTNSSAATCPSPTVSR